MADVQMPLTAHLEELRWRLLRVLIAVGIAFVGCYNYSEVLFHLLTQPLLSIPLADGSGDNVHLIGTGIVEAFFTKLKVSLIAGFFLASPIVFHQLWMFIAPGLYEHEKRYAIPFVLAATVFFLAGASFCYTLVLPVGYKFFVEQYGTIGVSPEIRISEYLTFTSRMLLAFGLTFELPVITFFLARIGVVTHQMMIGSFRYAVLVIFIVAAVLTPTPDAASQMLMAGPLLLLYIFSIGIAYVFGKKRTGDPESTEIVPQDPPAHP